MPKEIPDPTPDTMISLIYNRLSKENRTLVGAYADQGGSWSGTIPSMDFIDASVDALYALAFMEPPEDEATLHVELNVQAKSLLMNFQDGERSGEFKVSGVRFDKQWSDAAKAIFAESFKAGMQAALGF